MPDTAATPRPTPSTSLIGNLRSELMRRLPFSHMLPVQVDQFIGAARQTYFAPDETVLEPASGPVHELYCVRQGSVTGRSEMAELSGPIEYVAGDFFPISACLGRRPVGATYTATQDTFCLQVPVQAVQSLVDQSALFADFLNRRVDTFVQMSRKAALAQSASQSLAEQSLEMRLATLPRKAVLTCAPQAELAQVLAQMHERAVGSALVIDEAGAPLGILTQHDILGRVTLPALSLASPIAAVMSAPVQALDIGHTLQDAAMLMSRHGVRHVPVTEAGRVVNIVSERDLFALQRVSLNQLSNQMRATKDLQSLPQLALQIRRFARNLWGQGVHARQLTELISHLNDVLTERLVVLQAARHGLDLRRACWLAFGSEGRSEQTVATDQDNGLVFDSPDAERDRPAWLAFALDVNQSLDACGYPLCKGQVMASNPACCLTADEWQHRFGDWIEQGAPQDLLNASIYFDLRPLHGNLALAAPLRELIVGRAAQVPRFQKQMADNALQHRAPLNWLGAIDTHEIDGRPMLDLKLQGTVIFVEAARLFALAHGLPVLGTRERLEAAGPRMNVAITESESWVRAFEFLQMLRLQVQLGDEPSATALTGAADNPNLIDVDTLNDIDHRMLKETCRVARRLQQRLEMDYAV